MRDVHDTSITDEEKKECQSLVNYILLACFQKSSCLPVLVAHQLLIHMAEKAPTKEIALIIARAAEDAASIIRDKAMARPW